ncbi:MAG: DUF2807 domain-containing protein [Alphaproteobacteria bacterium]
MVHKLAITAIIGLTASAVCMGAAAAIGGQQFGKGFDGLDIGMFDDKPRCEVGGGAPINRTIEWDGSDHVGLSIPGRATYAPGNDDQVHISGNPMLVPHIRVRDGRVELDCRMGHNGARDIEITLPGREFRKFSIAGSGNLELKGLNQERVKLSIAGSGNIKADGRVERVETHIAGSGDIDTAHVESQRTEVHIAGSGNTDIAPVDEAEIHIAGSGDVNLHTNPRKLETHIAGSGRIHNVGS